MCIIYAEIFRKMSSGGLEVSFSIYILNYILTFNIKHNTNTEGLERKLKVHQVFLPSFILYQSKEKKNCRLSVNFFKSDYL